MQYPSKAPMTADELEASQIRQDKLEADWRYEFSLSHMPFKAWLRTTTAHRVNQRSVV